MLRGSRHTGRLHFKYSTDRFENSNVLIKRPRIDVIFRKFPERAVPEKNPEFTTLALVDSGADVCFISRTIANALRLDIDEKSKQTSTGAGGEFTTYRSKMYLEILYKGQRIGIDTVDVLFPESDPVGVHFRKNVLIGRSGLFDKYVVTFNNKQKTLDLKKMD